MRLHSEGNARRVVVIEIVAIVALAIAAGVTRNLVASRQYKLSWIREAPPLQVRIANAKAIPVQPLSSRAREGVWEGRGTLRRSAPQGRLPAAREQAELKATDQRPKITDQRPQTEVETQPKFSPHPDTPYVELSPSEIDILFARNALFIDARRTSSYEEEHIAGARSMPVGESDINDRLTTIANERDPAEAIVLYCNGGHCGDSYDLAQRLWGVGFNNLYIYKDGFPDWLKRARPVRTGSTP